MLGSAHDRQPSSPRPTALFVAADLPWPPDAGGRIATLRNLEAVASHYDTDLVALADPARPVDTTYLASLCRRVEVVPVAFTFGRHRARQLGILLRSILSLSPYRLRKFRADRLDQVLAGLRAGCAYDLVHLDQFGVAPSWTSGPTTTYGCQNVESEIYALAQQSTRNPVRRIFAWQEAAKLRRAERQLLPRFDMIFVLADDDARLLRQRGVERTCFLPLPAPRILERDAAPIDPVVLSMGTMSWYGVEDGLLWFRDKVWPRVRSRVPSARWCMVGPNAGPLIRRLDGRDGIEVVGYVDDLAPILRTARVGVVPLRVAGGVRIKLLELMAEGVPAVATSVGARGLRAPKGAGCLRADDPAAFADAVVDLLTDDARWLETVERGQVFLRERHTEALFREAMHQGIEDARRRATTRGASV
jgi:glycosyltransferase involved in cell wall biosynthesis